MTADRAEGERSNRTPSEEKLITCNICHKKKYTPLWLLNHGIRCRECHNAKNRTSYKKKRAAGWRRIQLRINDREWHRQYEKSYYKKPEVIERRNRYAREYFRKPEVKMKSNVRSKTRLLVKKGIIKKKPCLVCGSKKSQAHHYSYEDIYNVEWFCPVHHTEIHRGNKDAKLREGK